MDLKFLEDKYDNAKSGNIYSLQIDNKTIYAMLVHNKLGYSLISIRYIEASLLYLNNGSSFISENRLSDLLRELDAELVLHSDNVVIDSK